MVLWGTLQGALVFHSGTEDSSHPISLGCLFLESLFLSAEKGIVFAALISVSPVSDIQQVGGTWAGQRSLHLPPVGTGVSMWPGSSPPAAQRRPPPGPRDGSLEETRHRIVSVSLGRQRVDRWPPGQKGCCD